MMWLSRKKYLYHVSYQLQTPAKETGDCLCLTNEKVPDDIVVKDWREDLARRAKLDCGITFLNITYLGAVKR